MRFWDVGIVSALLAVLALLAVVAVVLRGSAKLRGLAIPPALLAGGLGLALGESGLAILPARPEDLEVIVYHTFAVVFITVGLQAPPGPARVIGSAPLRTGSARSLAVAIPTMGVAQAMLGFLLVALWWATTGDELHPGFGWMITLGFQQGPGQALALGSAWDSQGLHDGAQIGLLFAAFGFAYCAVLGVPLVAYARRRGWIDGADAGEGSATPVAPPRAAAAHVFEPLTAQVLIVAVVYVGVFGVLWLASWPLAQDNPLRATFWGFHFIVGAGLAIALRRGARGAGREEIFDDDLLARLSVLAVEVTTCAAIAAVELEVLRSWLVPILVFTTLAAGLTLLVTLWLSKRVFPEAPFAHALVLLGMSTGTVSTGLALLRMIDPELKGPVARNVVVAATAAVPLNAPLFLGVIPFSVGLWAVSYRASLVWPLVLLVIYAGALVVAWRRLTPARLIRPLRRLWPE